MLPTDERFLRLTPEQIDLIWQHYLLDHPEVEKQQEQYQDPDYTTKEKSLAVDERALAAKTDPILASVDVSALPVEI